MNETDQRQHKRRKEDMLFLPGFDQEQTMDFLMRLSDEERERMQLMLHLDTRERLFSHADAEEKKVEEVYTVLLGDPKKNIKGLKDTVADFEELRKRINVWLDGICFILKTVIPWTLATATGLFTLAKFMGLI